MVQLTAHLWRIQSQKGSILQDNITSHSEYEAAEYVKRYISSFQCWDYELVPLKAKVSRK